MIRPAGCAIKSIHQVELANLFSSKKSKMILLTLVVNPVKLYEGSVRTRNLTVTQESPNLSKSHAKTFFTFCGFHFLGVITVPTLQLAVIAQHDVLNFFFDSSWVLLELDQIRDIN
jgi:hypothetical protein